MARTKGGKTQYLHFSIIESACVYTVTKNSASDQQVVLPYKDGSEVVYATEMQKEFDFSSDDDNNCKVDKIVVTYTQDGKSGQKKEGPFPDVKFSMSEAEKGKKDILFSVGTMGKKADSSQQQVALIICGKETVTSNQQDKVERVMRNDVPNTIPKTEFNSWF